METIKGAYTSASIFTTNNKETAIDQYAIAQLQMICNHESSKGCRIRVMPDVHPGKVGTIGLTMTIGKKIICLQTHARYHGGNWRNRNNQSYHPSGLQLQGRRQLERTIP